MGKELKNIDELYRTKLGGHKVKAPAHIRKNVLSKFGINYLGIALTSIGVIGLSVLGYFAISDQNTLAEDPTIMPNSHLITENHTEIISETPPQQTASKSQRKDAPLPKHQNLTVATQVLTKPAVDSNSRGITTSKKQTVTQAKQNKPKLPVHHTGSNTLVSNKKNTKKTSGNSAHTLKQDSEKNTNATVQNDELKASTTQTMQPVIQEVEGINTAIEHNIKEEHSTQPKSTLTTENEAIRSQQKEPNTNVAKTNELSEQSTAGSTIDTTTEIENENEDIQANALAITEANPNTSDIDTNTYQGSTADSSLTAEAAPIDNITSPKKGYWMVNAGGGIKINNSKYNGPDSEFNSYLDKNQVDKLGYFGQFSTSYTLNNGLSFGMGLGYEAQSSKTSYWKDTTVYNIQTITEFSHTDIITEYDGQGNIINTYIDSVFITKIDTISNTSVISQFGTNKANYLQIPFQLGYRVQHNNWIFGMHGGVQINYLLNKTGTYYINNEILDLSTSSTILNKTAIQYNIGGDFSYNITRNVYLSGQINYSPSSTNYYQSTYANKQLRYFQYGFGLALKL